LSKTKVQNIQKKIQNIIATQIAYYQGPGFLQIDAPVKVCHHLLFIGLI